MVVLQSASAAGGTEAELPEQVPAVVLSASDEAAVRAALATVASYGLVATIVVLPAAAFAWDIAALRLPFLLAKLLQPALNAAAASFPHARAGFVAVTRLDGALGATGQPTRARWLQACWG